MEESRNLSGRDFITIGIFSAIDEEPGRKGIYHTGCDS